MEKKLQEPEINWSDSGKNKGKLVKFDYRDARCHFNIEKDTKKYWTKKKNLSFSPVVFEKSFDKVLKDAV